MPKCRFQFSQSCFHIHLDRFESCSFLSKDGASGLGFRIRQVMCWTALRKPEAGGVRSLLLDPISGVRLGGRCARGIVVRILIAAVAIHRVGRFDAALGG